MFSQFSRLPGGNVRPSRFVTLQTDNTVIESSAGDDVWGISQAATRNAPIASGFGTVDDGYAGISGDPAINIHGPGCDQCYLELGGTVSIGQNIKSGSAGVGVVATTDKDRVGAEALQSGVSGEIILVKPRRFDVSI